VKGIGGVNPLSGSVAFVQGGMGGGLEKKEGRVLTK